MSEKVSREVMEKEIFGSSQRVRVLELLCKKSIQPAEEFSQKEVREEIGGYKGSFVSKELARLEKIGVAERVDLGRERSMSILYELRGPLFWQGVGLILDHLDQIYSQSSD
jgi:DNA-binding transcriptional ArsR family regulator